MADVYPVVGAYYIITEWDGTKEKVRVTAVSKKKGVTFRYEDAQTHTVTPRYFAEGLHACGVK